VLSTIEGVLPAREARDAGIAIPILTNRAKIGKSAGKAILLNIGFLLIAPNDIPLGVAEVRIVLRTTVVFNVGSEGLSFLRLRDRRMNLSLEITMPTARRLDTN
jgi:hypothetical protein